MWKITNVEPDFMEGVSDSGEHFKLWFKGKWTFEYELDTLIHFSSEQDVLYFLNSRYKS